jgi:hypothetical protein
MEGEWFIILTKRKKKPAKTVDLIMKESELGGTQRSDSKSEGQR